MLGGMSGGCDLKIPKCFMLLSFPGAGSGGAPGGERARTQANEEKPG